MQPLLLNQPGRDESFFRWASALAMITVLYNLAEGVISVSLGMEDDTIALFGFGVDSFVEVISGIGIWHMVWRMRRNGDESADRFEKTALRVTGTSFYLLTAGLAVSSALNIYRGSRPETTFWGIVVSAVSIMSMWILIHYKTKIGRKYNSRALLADAACTRTCIYLSVVLLISSIGYEATGIGMLDSIGAAGIAILSFREGRESFGKAKGAPCSCEGRCS